MRRRHDADERGDRFSQYANAAIDASELNTNVAMMEWHADAYLNSHNPEELKRAREYMKFVCSGLDLTKSAAMNEEEVAKLEDFSENLDEPIAPNFRTFSLNSKEFYDTIAVPRERPWIPNGALPRAPRVSDPQVLVEGDDGAARWQGSGEVMQGG